MEKFKKTRSEMNHSICIHTYTCILYTLPFLAKTHIIFLLKHVNTQFNSHSGIYQYLCNWIKKQSQYLQVQYYANKQESFLITLLTLNILFDICKQILHLHLGIAWAIYIVLTLTASNANYLRPLSLSTNRARRGNFVLS